MSGDQFQRLVLRTQLYIQEGTSTRHSGYQADCVLTRRGGVGPVWTAQVTICGSESGNHQQTWPVESCLLNTFEPGMGRRAKSMARNYIASVAAQTLQVDQERMILAIADWLDQSD